MLARWVRYSSFSQNSVCSHHCQYTLQRATLHQGLSLHNDTTSDEDDPDDYEMAPFDLSRVMSALQGMKEEIAGMENEDERRKAAAKVALGLVYGLEAERGELNEERRGDGARVGGEAA